MRADDLDAFGVVLREHFACFCRELKPEQIDAYFGALKFASLSQVERACGYLSRKGTKFPGTAGEIAKAIRDFDNEVTEPTGPRRCAWRAGSLQCEYRGVGFYPVNPAEPNGPRYCPDHHDCTSSREGAAIVQRSIRDKQTRPKPVYAVARGIANFLETKPDGSPAWPHLNIDGIGGRDCAVRVYGAADVGIVESLIRQHGSVEAAYGLQERRSIDRQPLPKGMRYADVDTALAGTS